MATSPERFVPNDTTQPLLKVTSPLAHLKSSLALLTTQCPPLIPWQGTTHNGIFTGGLLFGPTSIAVLFFHLSRTQPNLEINGKLPSAWCEAYVSLPRPSTPSRRRGGIMNEEITHDALSAILTGDMAYVETIVSLASSSLQDPTAKIEWMSGHGGTLYLIRLLKHYLPISAARLDPLVLLLIEQISTTADETGTWAMNGKHYLGPVHGSIGLLTQVVLSSPQHAKQLEGMLEKLLDLQDEHGNWPSSIEGQNSLLHFCHGAPCFVLSLVAVRPHFSALQQRIDSAVARARELIWREGLLVKEPCLCHGITGNALCFNEREKMEHFLAMTAQDKVESGEWEASSDPWGLYFGLAGRAWGWMVLGGWGRGLIGYTDV